jgi:glucokinase
VADFVLSIDVGGTKTLVAIVDGRGRIVDEWQQPTRGSADDDVHEVARFARECRDEFLAKDLEDTATIVAVAAGFPEYVSADGRLTSHEVLRWTEQPADALAKAIALGGTGLPIVIESDVRLGARGEATLGAGSHVSSNFYVSLGTGLSSVFVLDSHAWSGDRFGRAHNFNTRIRELGKLLLRYCY